jgi:hypothetical protein
MFLGYTTGKGLPRLKIRIKYMRWAVHNFSASVCSFRQICGGRVDRTSFRTFSGPALKGGGSHETTLEKLSLTAATRCW